MTYMGVIIVQFAYPILDRLCRFLNYFVIFETFNNALMICNRSYLSLRSYYNDKYGAFDYCYNFGTKEDMPSSCDPDKGKYMSFGIQKLVDE